MDHSYGWAGKILRVDLGNGKIWIESTDPYKKSVLGDRGIGHWILLKEMEPNVDPLGEENIVIMGAGPLVGTLAPAACRTSFETKNPKTGGIVFSNMGGHFAPELKYAGFDAVVISGMADKPTVLVISDGKGELKEWKDVWGLTTFEADEVIKRRLGGSGWHIACIGPAGENLCRGASVIGERGRAAGRGGVGAVLGSKKLKAIAIRGTGSVLVAKPEAFMGEVRELLSRIAQSTSVAQLREGGTLYQSGAGGMDYARSVGSLNYRNESWPLDKCAKLREPIFRSNFEVRRLSCFNCPAYCSHFYRVVDGPYSGEACEGLQTNTLRAFSSNLDIDDPAAVIAGHCLCSKLGIDVDTAAAAIGWAFDLYERGILTSNDTNGMDLSWGNHKVLPRLLKEMAHREGFGALLSDGVYRAAQKLGRGSEKYALSIKKADVNEQGMRWNESWAFGIGTSTRGAGHLDGAPITCFGGMSPAEALKYLGEKKKGNLEHSDATAELVIWHERFKALIDAVGLCYFMTHYMNKKHIGPEDLSTLLHYATGVRFDKDELFVIGDRIHSLGKAFNTLHSGFERRDDYPPERLVKEPALTGLYKGAHIDLDQWEKDLDSYYRAHQWDKSTSWQTREQLERLGLDWVADKLEKHERLPSPRE